MSVRGAVSVTVTLSSAVRRLRVGTFDVAIKSVLRLECPMRMGSALHGFSQRHGGCKTIGAHHSLE